MPGPSNPAQELGQHNIFVVGAARSGTTLAAAILGGHSQVFAPAPGETNFFEDVWPRRAELGFLRDAAAVSTAASRTLTLFGRYGDPASQELVDRHLRQAELIACTLRFGGGLGGLYLAFTQLLARAHAKTHYCDDTPKHLYYLEDIFKLLPGARGIACLRDPRDYLSSYKYHWLTAAESQRIRDLYHPILTALLWRSSANTIRKLLKQFPERIYLLRYEKLVSNAEAEIRRLFEFLDLDFDPAILEVEKQNSSYPGNPPGIFSSSVGRWQSNLTAEEIWWAQRLAARQMQHFGYPKTSTRASWSRLFDDLRAAPGAFRRAMRANRGRRGPFFNYATLRLGPILRR